MFTTGRPRPARVHQAGCPAEVTSGRAARPRRRPAARACSPQFHGGPSDNNRGSAAACDRLETLSREKMPRVSVCVATFRRPEGLRLLLEALAELRFETCAVPDVEVVV